VLLVHHDGTAAPPDDNGTVFPFERLQRVPDLHRLTFLPNVQLNEPDTKRYSDGEVGQPDCAGAAPLDRATSAPFAGADPALEQDNVP
jgi:hypothetical protein